MEEFDSELSKSIQQYRFYPQHHRSLPAPNPEVYSFEQDVETKTDFEEEPQKVLRLSKAERKQLKFEESMRRKAGRQKAARREPEKAPAEQEAFAWFHHPSWGVGAGLTARPAPRDNAEMDEWVKGGGPASAVITLLKETDPAWNVVGDGVQRLELQWLFTPIDQISNARKQLGASDWQNFHAAVKQGMQWLLAGERVVVHCVGGFHRTGIFCYVLLRRSGLSMEAATDAIKHMREKTWYEMTAQFSKRPMGLIPKAEDIYQKLEEGRASWMNVLLSNVWSRASKVC